MVEPILGNFNLVYAIAHRASFVQDAVDEIIEKDRENGDAYFYGLRDHTDEPTRLLEYERSDAVLSLILTALSDDRGLELVVTSDKMADASYFDYKVVTSVVEGIELLKDASTKI